MKKETYQPFGYEIINVKAVIHKEEAAQLRKMIAGYLDGLGYAKAAEAAGLIMTHSSVRNLFQNKRYLGDDFYPAIIDQKTYNSLEIERLRRQVHSPIKYRYKASVAVRPVQTEFVMEQISNTEPNVDPHQKNTDPFKKAEYRYSRIVSVDTNTAADFEADLKDDRSVVESVSKGR